MSTAIHIILGSNRSWLHCRQPRLHPSAYAGFALGLGLSLGLAVQAQAPSAPVSVTALPDAPQIIEFLDQTIEWYRRRAVEPQLASEVTGQLLASENRRHADQVVRLGFDFARGAATLIAIQDRAQSVAIEDAGEFPALLQLQAKLDQELKETTAELAADRLKLASATGARRSALQGQVLELPGELDLLSARREAVGHMLEFLGGQANGAPGGTGLRAQIETLAATVAPTNTGAAFAAAAPTPANAPQAPLAPPVLSDESSSLWERFETVFGLARRERDLQVLNAAAAQLAQSSRQLSAPFLAQLRTLSAQGDRLALQADSASSSQLAAARKQLDWLAQQFKSVSAVLTPLNKQIVLLRIYQNNLATWLEDLRGDSQRARRALWARLGVLAAVLALVLVGSALWKRAVYRYVHDGARRHQFLFLRRVIVWSVVALIVAFACAGQFGSFATFAGLLTAGVAVALQNVLLAVAGYFFLIGKYGIRVGDRVQMGGVTGEVLDIGLVRLHLLEFDGGANGPTGRVVAFSNSIVFQSAAGLYKNLAGIQLAWHEMTLLLVTNSDHGSVRTRLLKAVQDVLGDYQDSLVAQARALEHSARLSTPKDFHPNIRLRLSAAGVEATVYYPVDAPHATEIDERVAQALLAELDREPKLKLAGADLKLRT